MELATMRARKSAYLDGDNFKDGWLIELKGVADRKWTVLSFRDKGGKESTWYDSEESAKAKIQEIKDAINAHLAQPNTHDQKTPPTPAKDTP